MYIRMYNPLYKGEMLSVHPSAFFDCHVNNSVIIRMTLFQMIGINSIWQLQVCFTSVYKLLVYYSSELSQNGHGSTPLARHFFQLLF